jgi:hypothetical protein
MLCECVPTSPPIIERNSLIFLAGLLPVLAGLFEFDLRVQCNRPAELYRTHPPRVRYGSAGRLRTVRVPERRTDATARDEQPADPDRNPSGFG